MKSLSEVQLIDLVVNWVRENKQSNNSHDMEITADTDLFASGLLDSFGFVDLIVYIESLDGCKVDLTEVDPEQFSVVRGLCKIALNGTH